MPAATIVWRMLRTAVMVAALAAAVSWLAAATGQAQETEEGREGVEREPESVPDLLDLIVQVDEQVGDGPLLAWVAERNRLIREGEDILVRRTYERLPFVALRIATTRTLVQWQRELLTDETLGVVAVTEDIPATTELDLSVPHVGADTLHDYGEDGSGVAVAILDTGIDRTHPFFAGRVVEEACFSDDGRFLWFESLFNDSAITTLCPNGDEEQTGTGAADSQTSACVSGTSNICTHGPHVAGIAAGDGSSDPAAPAAGVAPGADIVALQVFNRRDDTDLCAPRSSPCMRSSTADRIAAMDHLLGLADDGLRVVAANLSIGGGRYSQHCGASQSPERVAFQALREAGIVTVASAGNSGFGEEVSQPGCEDNILTVGNTLLNDTLRLNSNRGPLVDVLAPGSFIISAVADQGYGDKSGTSMAAPHVAGAVALLAAAQPGAGPDELIELITGTGVPITYPTGPGIASESESTWTATQTTPRLDLPAALAEALGGGPQLGVDTDTVTVEEGDEVTVIGSISVPAGLDQLQANVGEVTRSGGSWIWEWTPRDGPRDSREVRITATDELGLTDTVSFDLEVLNVAPTVALAEEQPLRMLPGNALGIAGVLTDPGLDDRLSVVVECDATPGAPPVGAEQLAYQPPEVHATFSKPVQRREFTVLCRYDRQPDGGPFELELTARDRDGDETTLTRQVRFLDIREGPVRSFEVAGSRLDPTEALTLLEQLDRELTFDLDVLGPPDLDLDLRIDLGDDRRIERTFPVGSEQDLDDEVLRAAGLRGVRESISASFDAPGLVPLEVRLELPDGPTDPSTAMVAVTGDEPERRAADDWAGVLDDLEPRRAVLDGPVRRVATERLSAYLEVAEHLSPGYGPDRPLTLEVARADLAGGDDPAAALRAASLAAWLDVAAGAVRLDARPVDEPERGTLGELLAAAEQALVRPSASVAEQVALTARLEDLGLLVSEPRPTPPPDSDDGADDPADGADEPDEQPDDTAPEEAPEDEPSALRFPDVNPDSVHAEAIARLVAAGITEGFPDGTFRPALPVSRQQMAAFLARALELAPPPQLVGFADVDPDSVHAESIEALAAAGVTEGCAPQRFCPQDPVTREQMASFLTRALELAPPQQPVGFADVDPDSVHAQSIEALAAAGVTEGCAPQRFCPQDPVTREQMASFLVRALDL